MNCQKIEWLNGDMPCEALPQTAEITTVIDDMTDINPAMIDCGIIVGSETDSSAVMIVKMSKNNTLMKIKSSADDFIFFFIENIIRYKKTDTRQAYYVVRLAKLLGVSQQTLSRVYAMFNWGGIEKGEKYLGMIDRLSGQLKEMLFGGKV
ncbi:MAG: hypothetical protein J6W76_01590, partial [Spirochaetales bacterium]|nr:hypothetical protein [Spirochaetales bacterium]